MLYATIELIGNKVALVRAKTKSGRLLPDDIDTTTINQAMTDILTFVQAQEPTEVEEAFQIKEQANQEVAQARQELTAVQTELAETRQQVGEAKEELSKAKSLFAKYDPKVKTYRPGQFLYDETNDKIVVINQEGQAEEAVPIEGAKATF